MKRCVWCFVVGLVLWAVTMPAWAWDSYYWTQGSLPTGYTKEAACEPPGSSFWTWCPQGGQYGTCGSPDCSFTMATIVKTTVCTSSPNTYIVDAAPLGDHTPSECKSSCPSGQTQNQTTGICQTPVCPQGTQFLGYGSSAAPQCLNGCAYAAGSETRYTEDGVLSRWSSSGATCSGGTTLTAASTVGCPNETPVDLKPLLCGLPTPCEEGKFLFMGQCVADTTESGCVLIDGEQVCAEADQNCVVVDGKRVCVEAPKPENLETYKENGCVWSFGQGAWVCPTETGKKTETSTTTSVTDPVTGQVTKTKVTTTKDNVLPGFRTSTTTTVYDSDGNELSSETVTKTEGGGGQGAALVAKSPAALGEKEDLDWLRTYEEVRDSLSTQWDQLEIVQAVKSFQSLSLSSVQGVCPEFCLPLWGETLCTTAHCSIWAQISFIIQGVLLALYGMAAIRIVLSA